MNSFWMSCHVLLVNSYWNFKGSQCVQLQSEALVTTYQSARHNTQEDF